MFPYWLMFGVMALGSLLVAPQDAAKRRPQPMVWLFSIALIIFVGLRYQVGADWFGYDYLWDRAAIPLSSYLERGDVGFSAIIWFLRNNGFEFWSINLLCAIIFIVGLTSFALRQPNPWLVFAVAFPYLVIVVGMSGIRQAAAFGFFLIAIGAFRDRRFVLASALLIAGSLFHASAIIMLGVAALSLSDNRWAGLAIFAVTAVVGTMFLGADFERYVNRYTTRQIQSGGILYRLLMNVVPALIYLRVRDRMPLRPHERTFWSVFAYCSIAFVPAAFVISSTTALDRLSLYFIPLQMFMLGWAPYIVARNRKNSTAIILGILGYLGVAMFVFLNYSSYAEAWTDYRSYLFDDVS